MSSSWKGLKTVGKQVFLAITNTKQAIMLQQKIDNGRVDVVAVEILQRLRFSAKVFLKTL